MPVLNIIQANELLDDLGYYSSEVPSETCAWKQLILNYLPSFGVINRFTHWPEGVRLDCRYAKWTADQTAAVANGSNKNISRMVKAAERLVSCDELSLGPQGRMILERFRFSTEEAISSLSPLSNHIRCLEFQMCGALTESSELLVSQLLPNVQSIQEVLGP